MRRMSSSYSAFIFASNAASSGESLGAALVMSMMTGPASAGSSAAFLRVRTVLRFVASPSGQSSPAPAPAPDLVLFDGTTPRIHRSRVGADGSASTAQPGARASIAFSSSSRYHAATSFTFCMSTAHTKLGRRSAYSCSIASAAARSMHRSSASTAHSSARLASSSGSSTDCAATGSAASSGFPGLGAISAAEHAPRAARP